MTLEQTINVDVASSLTDITSFQQSTSAKNQWTVTRAARSAIVGYLMEKAGIQQSEYLNKELRPGHVQIDQSDLKSLVAGIKDSGIPFVAEKGDKLYSISSGKAVLENVKNDLLNMKTNSQKWADEFKEECFSDAVRFEKAISQKKIKNFASAAVKVKITSKDKTFLEIAGIRDLFGRLLFLATEMKLDFKKCFQVLLCTNTSVLR